MRKIKVRINNKEVEGILIDKVYKVKRRKTIKGKTYVWEEYYIHVFVPKELGCSKFVLIKAEDIDA